ncbi:hypothetical protein [Fibrisoma limi]|uniref:hypothetical protein n=1 Tax=Fibrisoma limi TaxID=663275 RepID=UPI0005877F9B|nr:hypothetical protein [Fibrisoma limi]
MLPIDTCYKAFFRLSEGFCKAFGKNGVGFCEGIYSIVNMKRYKYKVTDNYGRSTKWGFVDAINANDAGFRVLFILAAEGFASAKYSVEIQVISQDTRFHSNIETYA